MCGQVKVVLKSESEEDLLVLQVRQLLRMANPIFLDDIWW